MVSFSLRQCIFYLLLKDPSPVSFQMSQFGRYIPASKDFAPLRCPSKTHLLASGLASLVLGSLLAVAALSRNRKPAYRYAQ